MSRAELLASYWTICGGAEPHTDQEWSPFGLRERAEAASKAGFTGLGIWHADLLHLRERHSLAEMRRILEDNGIRHLELEFLTDWFLPPGDRRTASDTLRRTLLESARALGARHIKVGDFFDSPVSMPQLIDAFAGLCREAADHGTRIVFELMPFSVIDSLEDALALVEGADQPNGGLCIDLWHVVKLGIPYERVAAIPQRYLGSIEINDGYLKSPPGMTLARGNDRPPPVLRRGGVRRAWVRRPADARGLFRALGYRGTERRASPRSAARRGRATGVQHDAGAVRRVT